MKIYRSFLIMLCLSSFLFFSCDTILDLLGSSGGGSPSPSFTESEAVEAMKSALNVGAEASSKQLSQVDAYYSSPLKIPLPPEVESAIKTLRSISGAGDLLGDLSDDLVEKVVLSVNRSAEEAITGMTVQDGIGIVKGERDAATVYLKDKTYNQLMKLYQPKMKAVLKKDLIGSVSADDAWKTLTGTYNDIVSNQIVKTAAGVAGKELVPINTNLSEYVTGKALDGVFIKVAEEEGKIRDNPLDYAENIIKKVFGAVKGILTN
ncbi:MAG: DUF4197 domain-containing protein [Spirochaetaceae bacterium]|nr:DUF4197 domain-containing protein [Spirochaetaceae bacterium]